MRTLLRPRKNCGFENRRSVRVKRNAKGHVLALAGADYALNVGLIHIGLAPGHGLSSKSVVDSFLKGVYIIF
jgi:hypothetical protein